MRIFAPVCCINWIQFQCISNLQVTQRDWTWNQWAPGIHQHIFNASRNTYKKSTSSFHFNWEKTHIKTWSFFVPLISYLEISNYHPIWNDYLKKMTLPKYEFFSVFPSLKKNMNCCDYTIIINTYDMIIYTMIKNEILMFWLFASFFVRFRVSKNSHRWLLEFKRENSKHYFFPRKINWVLKVLFSCSTGLKNRERFYVSNKIFFLVFYDMFGFSSFFSKLSDFDPREWLRNRVAFHKKIPIHWKLGTQDLWWNSTILCDASQVKNSGNFFKCPLLGKSDHMRANKILQTGMDSNF